MYFGCIFPTEKKEYIHVDGATIPSNPTASIIASIINIQLCSRPK